MQTLTADPLQAVEFSLGPSAYGSQPDNIQTYVVSTEKPPEIGMIFVEDIKVNSAILALPDEPTRKQILIAYGKDIKTLGDRRDEADTFMQKVLEVGLVKSAYALGSEDNREKKAALLTILQPLGMAPQIPLTAERMALPETQLASWLKQAFSTEIDSIARRVAAALHVLSDCHLVGLIDWKEPDVCKFHYFTFKVKATEKEEQEITGDITSWNTLTTTVTKKTKIERTRHTHHVAGAAIHKAEDYHRRMPARIRKLINSYTPPWLRPHLVIVDGLETLTERVTTTADEQTSVTTESVLRYDPVVAIGPYALVGWNEHDVSYDPEPKPRTWKTVLRNLGIIAILVGGIAWFITHMVHKHNERHLMKDRRAYAGFVEEKSKTSQEFTIHSASRLNIPLVVNKELYFNGVVGQAYGSDDYEIEIVASDQTNSDDHPWKYNLKPVPDDPKAFYGDIYLGDPYHLDVVLHVSRATSEEIRYTVEQTEPRNKKYRDRVREKSGR